MTTKSLASDVSRDAEGVKCECGGYAERDNKMTVEEIKGRGCGRDRPEYQCCARAFVCAICKTRWLGEAEPPEMDMS
jgi:hypothetical protein